MLGSYIYYYQWRFQEFQTRARGPEAVEFSGSGDCLDGPLHIP